jgi:ATP-dependent Clp protease ATP-binding subunit ClpA
MFERFTDRARRVVVLAQEEARILNHNYIGTEHILLGLLREDEGVAAQALKALDISLETVRQQVEEIIGQGQQARSGHIPFTPRAKKVLELSLREALQLGHNYIGTEHILLGLIREGHGVAAQVLVRLGADLDRVRQQVVELVDALEGETETSRPLAVTPRARERGGEVLRMLRVISARLEAIEQHLGIAKQHDGAHGQAPAERGVPAAGEATPEGAGPEAGGVPPEGEAPGLPPAVPDDPS